MKHTSGPWRVVLKENAIGPYVFSIGNFQIAVVGPALIRFGDGAVQRMNSDEAHANAQLIAAAPALLDTLVAAVAEAKPVSSRTYMRQGIDCTEVVREDVWPDWLEPARAAIAAAKGQTP